MQQLRVVAGVGDVVVATVVRIDDDDNDDDSASEGQSYVPLLI